MSLVINTCDRRDRLAEALESLSFLHYRNFEVIVVNGPSTDGTDILLRRYAEKVKLGVCETRCLGLSRNIGIDLSAGEIVAFLDDDAVPQSDWLEKLNAAYDVPDTAAAGGFVFDIPLDRIEYRICTSTRTGTVSTDAPGPADRYLGRGADPFLYLAGCNMSFRRSALVEIGGFNQDFIYGYDDVEVCCRIIDAGYRIAVLEDAIVKHYRAPNAVRDEDQTIRDIYPYMHARAVFALQSLHQPATRDDIVTELNGSAQSWRNHAEALRTQGTFRQEEYEHFVQRIDDGLRDGISVGTTARRLRNFDKPPRFLRYHQ